MRRTSVRQIIARHAGKNHIFQFHDLHGFNQTLRLRCIQQTFWISRFHVTKSAGARARFAHQHKRSGAAAPAFGNIRAMRFGAHRSQFFNAQNRGDVGILPVRRPDFEPLRFRQSFLINFQLLRKIRILRSLNAQSSQIKNHSPPVMLKAPTP